MVVVVFFVDASLRTLKKQSARSMSKSRVFIHLLTHTRLSTHHKTQDSMFSVSILRRKRFIRTFLPQKVIVPDFFSHSVKELIVWSPERLWARKKHPAARSIDRGTRSYVFVKVHAPKRSRGSCKCDSWKFIGGKLLSNEEKQLHPIRRVKMDTNRWKRSQ